MTQPAYSRRRSYEALALLIAILAMANIVRSLALSEATQWTFTIAIAAAAVAIGRTAGVTRREVGLNPDHLHEGLRYGLASFVLVALVVTVAAIAPWLGPIFDDSRADAGVVELLIRVVVVIPIGTVLVEELIFRGELLALLRRVTPTAVALVVCSVVFGLWHVFPAWLSPPDNTALEEISRTGAAFGTFVSTTLAGLVFGWLRLVSGSLVAPILAHTATNTIPLLAAALVAH